MINIIWGIFIIVGIIALSNFIWNIEVTGNDKIAKEDILKVVEERTDLKLENLKIP